VAFGTKGNSRKNTNTEEGGKSSVTLWTKALLSAGKKEKGRFRRTPRREKHFRCGREARKAKGSGLRKGHRKKRRGRNFSHHGEVCFMTAGHRDVPVTRREAQKAGKQKAGLYFPYFRSGVVLRNNSRRACKRISVREKGPYRG